MTPKTLTIAISGSRTLRDKVQIYNFLDERAMYFAIRGYLLHLHLGDAQGVDATAIYWARERNAADRRTIFFANPLLIGCFDAQPGEECLVAANWQADGWGAGHIRNGSMLSGEIVTGERCSAPGCHGADVLLVIRNRNALNRGTDNCIQQARTRNIAIHSLTVDGPMSTGAGAEWLEEPGAYELGARPR